MGRVDSIAWYHTFDLPGGIVTPGIYDHRRAAAKVPFPSLAGKRCLDAASSDGFWAFEMARRGAAEVVSLDLSDASRQDWQGYPGQSHDTSGSGRAAQAFQIVRDATGLDVERRDGSVYDLSPRDYGQFDFVFMGNILLHLSDPARALKAVHTVTSGQLLSYELVLLTMSILRPRTPRAQLWHTDDARWWTPNMAAHRRLIAAAGFEIERSGGPLLQPFGAHLARWPSRRATGIRTHGLRAASAYWLFVRQFGAPTAWVLARPIAAG
jgi:tRNA (mo5U34)-methyltransferase